MRVGIARGRVKLGLIFSFNGAFLPSSSERPSECVAYLPRAPATEPGSVGPTPRRIQGQQWRSVHSRSLDGWMSAVLTLETVGILDGEDGADGLLGFLLSLIVLSCGTWKMNVLQNPRNPHIHS